MALSAEDVQAAVAGLRQGIEADGAQLELAGIEPGAVHFRLLIGSETCRECILPPEALEPMLAGCLEALGAPAPRVTVRVEER